MFRRKCSDQKTSIPLCLTCKNQRVFVQDSRPLTYACYLCGTTTSELTWEPATMVGPRPSESSFDNQALPVATQYSAVTPIYNSSYSHPGASPSARPPRRDVATILTRQDNGALDVGKFKAPRAPNPMARSPPVASPGYSSRSPGNAPTALSYSPGPPTPSTLRPDSREHLMPSSLDAQMERFIYRSVYHLPQQQPMKTRRHPSTIPSDPQSSETQPSTETTQPVITPAKMYARIGSLHSQTASTRSITHSSSYIPLRPHAHYVNDRRLRVEQPVVTGSEQLEVSTPVLPPSLPEFSGPIQSWTANGFQVDVHLPSTTDSDHTGLYPLCRVKARGETPPPPRVPSPVQRVADQIPVAQPTIRALTMADAWAGATCYAPARESLQPRSVDSLTLEGFCAAPHSLETLPGSAAQDADYVANLPVRQRIILRYSTRSNDSVVVNPGPPSNIRADGSATSEDASEPNDKPEEGCTAPTFSPVESANDSGFDEEYVFVDASDSSVEEM
ncbi:hypothetical protein BJ878DRAFT_516437 [Calycina marina]|uniref:Uncharacterized protein n=1 Tax=Calycina marina TaxID=1763456 RepID=A0A9P7YYF3_9HELO|nr:hypothetical protein BJ878DRAFT_516437 [Calycina marina]